jgi:hypothetical protein
VTLATERDEIRFGIFARMAAKFLMGLEKATKGSPCTTRYSPVRTGPRHLAA